MGGGANPTYGWWESCESTFAGTRLFLPLTNPNHMRNQPHHIDKILPTRPICVTSPHQQNLANPTVGSAIGSHQYYPLPQLANGNRSSNVQWKGILGLQNVKTSHLLRIWKSWEHQLYFKASTGFTHVVHHVGRNVLFNYALQLMHTCLNTMGCASPLANDHIL